MSDVAIEVCQISKRFKAHTSRGGYHTLRDAIANGFAAVVRPTGNSTRILHKRAEGEHHFWALKDVLFEVKRGEVLGIIGRNGAGKSTLLKILSRITEPTRGHAIVHGRIGALLEAGTGFHPELTGRENVYLSGSILGMTRSEIVRKLDAIVDFAEVTKFVDTPVKYYSSGMHLRLAFSVAAHLEPEILIVDEVLAVGDLAFQRKCLERMKNVAAEGRTVLFVSHNLAAVKELCRTGLVLRRGCVDFSGSVVDAMAHYSRELTAEIEGEGPGAEGWRGVTLNGKPTDMAVSLDCAVPLVAQGTVTAPSELTGAHVYCLVKNAVGDVIVHSEQGIGTVHAGDSYRARVSLPPLWLASGVYAMYLKLIGHGSSGQRYNSLSHPIVIDCSASTQAHYRASLSPTARWEIEPDIARAAGPSSPSADSRCSA